MNSNAVRMLCTVLISSIILCVTSTDKKPSLPFSKKSKRVKNLIILIPDGCGVAHMTIARVLKGSPLAQDALNCGLVNTCSANSWITGSAAAATACATGYKTFARYLAVAPDSVFVPTPYANPASIAWRPVATLLEAARLSGRSTGIVVTCNSNHATPAAYSAHWHERNHGNLITLQQVYQNLDIVLAGGYGNLLPKEIAGGKRNDGCNLTQVLASRGYSVITTTEELEKLPQSVDKIWGAFANNHLMHALDARATGKNEPSLASHTKRAIAQLSKKSRKGFVLVVEGSQIDWASHDNDPVGVATEYLAFDSAVTVALEYARKNKHTEVLIFPDHDNGGMSFGIRGDNYTATPRSHLNPIDSCTMTCGGLFDSLVLFAQAHDSITPETVAEHLKEVLKITDISKEDKIFELTRAVNAIAAGTEKKTSTTVALLGIMVSKRAHIGWTTDGHTAHNVPLYSLLLHNCGTLDNTDIARYCEHIMNINLQKTERILFNAADSLFTEKHFKLTIDTASCCEGAGALTVVSGETKVEFPFNRDFAVCENDTLTMKGITVYSTMNNTVYLPLEAKRLVEKRLYRHIQHQ